MVMCCDSRLLGVQMIERLLLLAQRYIIVVEVGHSRPLSFTAPSLTPSHLTPLSSPIFSPFSLSCFSSLSFLPHLHTHTHTHTHTYAYTYPPAPHTHTHQLTLTTLLFILTPSQENHHFPRYLPPHGACFLGHPITLSISSDQPKTDFKLDVRACTYSVHISMQC